MTQGVVWNLSKPDFLERAIVRVGPCFGNERDAGEHDITTAGLAFRADALDRIPLAIGCGCDAEAAEFLRGIAQDKLHDLAVGAFVERPHKDIRGRFDEPALQMAADRRGHVVANEDSHRGNDQG